MSILFIGGGNMASAMIGGLVARGYPAAEVAVVEVREEARMALAERFGVRTYAGADSAALACETIVLAVKPQQMREVVAPLAAQLNGQVVISIAAGIRLTDLSRWLGGYQRLVRAMPNTPALIGSGIAGLFALPAVDAAGRAQAETVLQAVGETLWVEREDMMDGVTAVTGSGPAYVFYFMEALQSAAGELGFDAATAQKMALATVLGAARLAESSGEPPAQLREKVTSKGGTTAAALETMRARAVAEGIAAGVRAAAERGRELGEILGREG